MEKSDTNTKFLHQLQRKLMDRKSIAKLYPTLPRPKFSAANVEIKNSIKQIEIFLDAARGIQRLTADRAIAEGHLKRISAFFNNFDDEDTVPVSQTSKIGKAMLGLTGGDDSNSTGPSTIYNDPWSEYFWGKGVLSKPDSGSSCNHKWKMYTGLVEQFEFCTECNIKKGESK